MTIEASYQFISALLLMLALGAGLGIGIAFYANWRHWKQCERDSKLLGEESRQGGELAELMSEALGYGKKEK